MKALFDENIRKAAINNSSFKKIIKKGKDSLLEAISLKPKEKTKKEIHGKFDKISVIVQGKGTFFINGKKESFQENSLIYVPKGVEHTFVNSGNTELKLLSVCATQSYMKNSF